MVKYENQCVDCAVPGYPCLGSSCPRRNVPVYYCDKCGEECDELVEIDGEHYCEECATDYLKEMFDDLNLWEQAELLDVYMRKVE